ncbi:MAG TPA: penicillin-binding transpeptidase domain-containing protein [Pirellulales bacterium]|nr:penicillin-binding transpeptidase domain-containing protein [Pirellulales bacterium]
MPAAERTKADAIDAAARLRWLLATVGALAAIVLARVVALELWYGDQYRAVANQPIERTVLAGAARGRILAGDGTVLAYDREAATLAIHYRYLERPPNPSWLRRQARSRLPRRERRNADRVAAECRRIEVEQSQALDRLANWCGLSPQALGDRLQVVQRRVERIAHSVQERQRREKSSRPAIDEGPWWRRFVAWLDEEAGHDPLARIDVAEEYEYHPVFVGLTLEAVAEIEGFPDRYPGARVVTWRKRIYPQGALAAHVVGYVPDTSTDPISAGDNVSTGRQGVERQFDSILRGTPGIVREATDHSGRLVSRHVERAAEPGRDVRLTIDPPLTRAADELLDQALQRRMARDGDETIPAGGAIVVLDADTGSILCAASAPRFEPEMAARGDPVELERLFDNRSKPLFDRVSRMALPPGSVFKPLTAIALVEEGVVEPARPFFCQGYLQTPEKERCQLFREMQVGHGALTLPQALARSCNVYFFHHAGVLGGSPLLEWAERFGFGQVTGVDLPDEASGGIGARQNESRPGAPTRDETLALAIGQGTLRVTPLQMARLMAAIANGGRLVTPHVATAFVGSVTEIELKDRTLATVRRGLEQAVSDPQGTAYATLRLDIEVAGKTGTAETASGKDHAWFAGYAPAEHPKVAFAVVVEYAGGGGETAVPIARRLIEKMTALGYFARRSRLAAPATSPFR